MWFPRYELRDPPSIGYMARCRGLSLPQVQNHRPSIRLVGRHHLPPSIQWWRYDRRRQ